MPFVYTEISGNENFGGYLSLNEGQDVKISHDMTYEIEEGRHNFVIYSKSKAERSAGKMQAKINSMASCGSIIDSITDKQASGHMGDSWSFDITLKGNECLIISINSKGDRIIGSPGYRVEEFEEEVANDLRAKFQKMREEEEAALEAYRNTPRRSKGMIIAGLITAGLSAFGMMNFFTMATEEEQGVQGIAVFAVGIVIGALLLFFGMKKKIRK